jgi:hypothetical protein
MKKVGYPRKIRDNAIKTARNKTQESIKAMPTISDPNVVQAIAREYISNGRDKSAALITVGYKPSYALSGKGTILYEKQTVKDAIDRIEADLARHVDVTPDEIIARLRQLSGLEAIADDDEGSKCTRAEQIRSLELLGRYKAMFTDNINDNREGLTISVTPPTAEPVQAAAPKLSREGA